MKKYLLIFLALFPLVVYAGWNSQQKTDGSMCITNAPAGAVDAMCVDYAGNVVFGGDVSAVGEISYDGTTPLNLDDGSGASPTLTFTDETNETAVLQKADSGFFGITTLAADGLNVLVGNLKIGNGVPTVALDGEDAYVEGTFEVDGAAQLDGAITATSSLSVSGAITNSSTITSSGNAVDLTLSAPTNGGNADAKNEFVGIPRIKGFVTGAGTNGAAAGKTVTGYIDETPAGEWTATANMTDATDAVNYRKGSASLKLTVGATPAAGNGADNPLAGGDEDWSDDESFGMWMMCDATTSAGDWVLEITDSVAGATTVNVPALASANKWTWVEVDISGVANASKDVITDIALDLSAAGAVALPSKVCNFDYAYKWDATEEDAMTLNVYEDGVIAVYSVVTASGQANTPSLLTEGTDFFVHYEAGNDFLVWITDQSAASLWGSAAIQ